MNINLKISFLIIFLGTVFAVPSNAEVPGHEFIGTKKCALCHKTEKQGNQFAIWQNSKHAKAFETLGTPEAKEVAAKMGIDNPQESPACLECHSTAYYFSAEKVTDMVALEDGVSCESCHGPGKDYMKKSIMEDREAAIANGLIIGDKEMCLKCHNERSPTFKPFNYEERWEQIKHPVP